VPDGSRRLNVVTPRGRASPKRTNAFSLDGVRRRVCQRADTSATAVEAVRNLVFEIGFSLSLPALLFDSNRSMTETAGRRHAQRVMGFQGGLR